MTRKLQWIARAGLATLAVLAIGCAPTIRGTIRAVPDRAGVAGARIVVESSEEAMASSTVESGRGGRFVIKDLPPGPYDLFFLKPGFVSREITGVGLPEKGHRKLEVDLLRMAVVQGLVMDHEGAPVSGARLYSALGSQTAVTDAEGAFRLEDLDPGPNVLFAQEGELVSGPVEVDLAPGPNELDIGLQPATTGLEAYEPGVYKKEDGTLTRPLLGDGAQ